MNTNFHWKQIAFTIILAGLMSGWAAYQVCAEEGKPPDYVQDVINNNQKVVKTQGKIEGTRGDLRYEQAVLSDLKQKYEEAKKGGYTGAMEKYEKQLRDQEKKLNQVQDRLNHQQNALKDAKNNAIKEQVKDSQERLAELERDRKHLEELKASREQAIKNGHEGMVMYLNMEIDSHERDLEDDENAIKYHQGFLDQVKDNEATKETLDLFLNGAKENLSDKQPNADFNAVDAIKNGGLGSIAPGGTTPTASFDSNVSARDMAPPSEKKCN